MILSGLVEPLTLTGARMDGSFNRWRDSPSFDGRKSFVISDSDEDIADAAEGDVLVIDSSDSSVDISIDVTPKK